MSRTSPLLLFVVITVVLVSMGCTASRDGRGRTNLGTRTPTDVALTLPADCARRGPIVFVALSPEIEEPLRRWTARFLPDVEVVHAPPLPVPRSAWTAKRNQYEAGALIELIDAHRTDLHRAERGRPIVVGFLPEDLHSLELPQWRWAFGIYRNRSAVVSLHRMADRPGRVLEAGASQSGGVELVPEVAARLSRHVARILGGLYCGFERTGPSTSVMRKQVLGVADLDEIDLSDWRREQ